MESSGGKFVQNTELFTFNRLMFSHKIAQINCQSLWSHTDAFKTTYLTVIVLKVGLLI